LETKKKLRKATLGAVGKNTGTCKLNGKNSITVTLVPQQAQIQKGLQLSSLSCWWSWL
jgi:ABC-type Mn2+/Zn2+ transport system ATPase subunit